MPLKNYKMDFLNIWMPNYNLMSGETSNNDQATIARMLPYVWLSTRNKASTTVRNQMMKKSKNEDIKPPIDACLEDYPAGDFDMLLLLTFHSFKSDTIISCPVGGTTAEPVDLADGNEAANPAWDLVCTTHKDQCMVDKQLAIHVGHKTLHAKCRSELAE
jgi:hypothetical protein